MNEIKTFETLTLNKDIICNLHSLGYEEMTPIQEKSLPIILQDKDLIAQAKTGSGKTVAFGIAIICKLDFQEQRPQALVLCPTRELAEQVSTEIRRLSRSTKNIKVLTLCGGTPEFHQQKSLHHGVHVIVGTPGRIQKLIKKGSLQLENLKILVLDEADRMLEMGFIADIEHIASYAAKERQTLLFSATFPEEIQKLSENLQNNAEQVIVDSQHRENVIQQVFYEVENHKKKLQALPLLLGHYQPESTIIFCKTKQICHDVAISLQKNGISALAIHGDLEQRERTLILTKFSNKSCLVLVATDVAARGIDIKGLQAVINYDLPHNPEIYVHRIGRTGRAGKEGLAITLFTANEKFMLTEIENYRHGKNQYQSLDSLTTNEAFNLQPPMTTLLMSGGRKDRIRAGDILGALTNQEGISGKDVGAIQIFDHLSYIALETSRVDLALAHLLAGKIKGRKFRLEKV